MPKLCVRYGAIGSGKTAHLVISAHQYEKSQLPVIVVKPSVDTRFGVDYITSRIPGLNRKADILLEPGSLLNEEQIQQSKNAHVLLVDECQFLSQSQVEQIAHLSKYVIVICYGIRTDYRGKLFPAFESLFAWADSIEEIETTCQQCHQRATHNYKLMHDKNKKANEIDLGADEKYCGLCRGCWLQKREQEDERISQYKMHTHSSFYLFA